MNPLEGLAQYLDRLERRLRLFAWTRGAAAVAGAALILTLVIVAALMWSAFTPSGLILGRFVLFLGVGGAIAAMLVVPLMRMNRRRAAQLVEQQHPGFDQRLLTFTERSRDNASDPFLPLLAEDTLLAARGAEPEQLITKNLFIRFASIGAVAASVLVWLMFWGPGVFGYGASLLWGSYSKDQPVKPFYSITVQPGSKTIRRKSDQQITASISGFTTAHANLWVQYASSSKFEEAPMEPVSGSSGFGFLLVRVPEDMQYYVEAAGVKSPTFKLHTIDLPAVKNIKVTYNYPSWTGLAAVTEDPGGDLRAVEGTVAKLDIHTDKALSNAQIVFEEGNPPIKLDATTDNTTSTNVPIQKDGTYHIAVMDHGELVRLTDDYFIEARKVGQPTVRIVKPAKDPKVSPIEEVTINVTAEDEYPLQALDLHYSVNGAPEKVTSLLKQKGAKQSDGSMMLSMEDFKLVPGDIVSIYATARDGKNSAKTDMSFVQAVPFEFEYSQSQAGGGGGGGGGDQDQQISEREKEIIAATFNQVNGDAKIKAAAAENGKYLSEVQAKLRDQAQSLANRTKARQLDGSGAAFQSFVKEMELAVASMTPASDKLKGLAFQDAMTPEQQALQHLLRAESTFRQIQVQISKGGGGGGGGGGAGRDLANLFDLELDKDKNQYETNSGASAEQQKQQQVDEAMKKLEELARRQKELADQQQNNPQQLAQQRYQQEMLRRETEKLKRDMEQLQRGDQNQQGQQSQSGQSGQGQPGQAGQQQQNARNQQQQQQRGGQQQQAQQQQAQQQQAMNRAMNDQLERAIKDLDQAEKEMGNAASAGQPGQQQQAKSQGQSEAQRAADQLKQAGKTLEGIRHRQAGSEIGDLAEKASQLASQQQDYEQRLRRTFGQGQNNQQTAQQMADEKQKMLDQWNQLQKEMQQTARDIATTQPGVSKNLRDTMGRSQQEEVASRMEYTEEALRRGMGQYAVLEEAPVTKSLNQLREELKKLEADSAAAQSAGANDDKAQIAMQQALNQAERIRREMEQLSNRGQQGQKPGQQPGQSQQPGQGQQQSQGRQPGQQPGQSQQQAQGQGQGQGQQQPGGQRGNATSPQGSPNSQGGGGGLNTAPRSNTYAGGYAGDPYGATNFGGADPRIGALPPAAREQVYNDLMRDIGRLRATVTEDKDLAREFQDLMRRAQELDPRHMNNDSQLGAVIGAQALSEIDEVELVLRRKLEAGDGSVRSTSPRNIPPGYADSVAEYTKRLSKQ